ncbi:MAG: hypothetical protein ACXVIY_00900 [Mucilaginibacter sp.]
MFLSYYDGTERATDITDIVKVEDLVTTPAKVNRRTGVMYISLAHFRQMPYEHCLFVMLHEKGHVVQQTTDEVAADTWAFNEYAKMGYSLNESVKALTRVLDDQNPEHYWRMYLQLERAKNFDREVNGNTKV